MGEMTYKQFQKRLDDLVNHTKRSHQIGASDFLTIGEISDAANYLSHGPDHKFWGGFEGAERQRLYIMPDVSYDPSEALPPIPCLSIQWSPRSGGTRLSHRDFLGALIGLGIERRTIGDLLVLDDRCLIFCLPHMSEFIKDHLFLVGRVTVEVSEIESSDVVIPTPEFKEISGTVASLRLDNVIKLCSKTSRSESLNLIKSGKVFLDSREILNPSAKVVEGSRITIRGLGKFKLTAIGKTTKKDRVHIQIDAYI